MYYDPKSYVLLQLVMQLVHLTSGDNPAPFYLWWMETMVIFRGIALFSCFFQFLKFYFFTFIMFFAGHVLY